MSRTLILITLLSTIYCQTYEGDLCTVESKNGVCQLLATCTSAITDLRRFKKQPQICEHSPRGPIVCCPNENSGKTRLITTSTSPPVKVNATLNYNIDSNFGIEEECPLPKYAITVNKNESSSKAWNKCIELADSVFPCKTTTLGLNVIKIRVNKCKRPPAAELILGGVAAKENEFPHMVVLGYENSEFSTVEWDCGGSLISEQWVMTAAHCVFNRRLKTEVSRARLGGGDLRNSTEAKYLYTIIEKKKHPDYSVLKIYNDIALLKLDRPVIYSETIRPACLHIGNEVKDDKAIAIGYGTIEDSVTRSNILLKVILNKFSHNECSEIHPPGRRSRQGILDSIQICYGSRNEIKDTCQGDSGGPLQIVNKGIYCTYTLIGITSTGQKCGVPGTPALYTRVSNYIPWIESIVWPN